MSDELPEGWTTVSLDDINEPTSPIGYGVLKPGPNIADGVVMLRVKDVQDGAVHLEDVYRITAKLDREFSRSRTQPGDLLITVQGSVGRLALVPTSLPVANISRTIARIRPRSSALARWLLVCLQAPQSQASMGLLTGGSTRDSLNIRDLRNLIVRIPPGKEQTRIVDHVEVLLSEVFRAQARLDRVDQLLKRFRQSLLAAACSGRLLQGVPDQETPPSIKPAAIDPSIDPDGLLPELPTGWQAVALGRLVTSSFYGPRFSSDDYVPDGIPTVRTTDMDFRGRIQVTDSPRVRVSHDEMRRFGLEDGDLLVTRTGATIGKCALYQSSLGPAIPSAYLIRFRLDRDMVLPDFVLLFLMSPFGQRLLGIGQTAVAQPNVNAKAIESFPFPLPPLSEQRRIVAEVERGLASLATIEKRLRVAAARAEKLPQAILAKAFSGELVPTEAELARAEGRTYESAEDLLRRLSSDREPDAKVVRAKPGRRVKPKN